MGLTPQNAERCDIGYSSVPHSPILPVAARQQPINAFEVVAQNSLEDLIYIMAINVEDALITGGAVPGKDYKIIDLYQLAMPLAQDLFKTNDKVDFVTGYPARHPGSSSFDPDDID